MTRKTRLRKAGAAKAKNTPSGNAARQKKAIVSKKRFKAASGKYAQVAVLDANTATFGADLLNVFTENVA